MWYNTMCNMKLGFFSLMYWGASLMWQIVFYWVPGIVIGSVIPVFGKQRIHSLMTVIQDKHLGAFGIIPASLIGILEVLVLSGGFYAHHRFVF